MKISDFRAPLRRNRKTEENDLGFGTKITGSGERLINRDGSFNILRTGMSSWTPYQSLVEMSWGEFFLFVVLFFLAVNLLFALIFLIIGVESIGGITPGSIWENLAQAFFLSAQTFTTVGYGGLIPKGVAANLAASLDALVGLMSFALVTGLFFSRFSKPKALILFSKNALITPFKNTGWSSLQFRIANIRSNKIINLEAKVSLTWIENSPQGPARHFGGLSLERDRIFFFPLNWTIVHVIDEKSPMYGKTKEELLASRIEILILIEGYDETFAQSVHVESSYTFDEILWDVKFAPMFYSDKEKTILELDKIHDVVPVDQKPEK